MSKLNNKAPTDEINLINFSFCDQKHNLNEYLDADVEDKQDFWKFLNKYESALRHVGQPVLPSILSAKNFDELQPFHKSKFICLKFSRGKCNSATNEVPNEYSYVVQQFRQTILVYLDFRQKEKFNQIKKLRRAQNTLPIAHFKNELRDGLSTARVLIVAGDTGCGKSTQVPQYMYEFGYRSIACTQPRRLACVSLSKRVAHEMLEDYSQKVGFQIRFEKSKTMHTNILFITEGLLLRQLAKETNLDQYDVLILDEIHERNLFGDFLLGVVKCQLRAKPSLKLILMSATINVELFYKYFQEEGVKLLEVPGRSYPIKTIFMPPPALELKGQNTRGNSSSKTRLDPAPYVQVLSLIDQKFPLTQRGDVLIFVSGVNEITSICDAIKEYAEQQAHWIILPLHSGLALAEQDKVFDYAPENMRKCIVSTNIAETSLTVDGIRFVIDSGKVKEMSYDVICKGQRLKEFWVSKSSAEQRKGRAGRTGPGFCYRLYSEKQYEAFEAYPAPEIFRVPLDSILLQMISMGLPNVRIFPFIEAPPDEYIEQTILSLKQYNAISNAEKITQLGISLANLPVNLSIGKMLLMGCVFPDIEKILTLASILSVQNPFTIRAFNDPKCELEREPLNSDEGDIFTLMCAFRKWLALKIDYENTRKWCYKLGIEEQRFYEITKLRQQFQNILEQCYMNCRDGKSNSNSTKSTSNLSSSERVRRHGELIVLRAIKRKQKYQEPRKRKILKQESYNVDALDDDDNNNDMHADIRDVDLRLRNDSYKMQLLYKSACIHKMRDIMLLKLIIASGFYPQLAIADEFNYCKGGSQQFFHTQFKPFLSVHPNSYFAKYYEILKLNDADIQTKPNYYTCKQPLSSRHQLLCYQSLLETVKPYLMNCIRLPAAQTLLILAHTIDTNVSVTRIVCDNWLCLEFPTPETGLKLLCRAIKVRRCWNEQLNEKLQELTNNVEAKLQASSRHNAAANNNGLELWDDLLDFMNLDALYTIKRLLPADLKTLYTFAALPKFAALKENPFAMDFIITENTDKGGCNVTENVVYGCLRELSWTLAMDAELENTRIWTCSYCSKQLKFNILRKLLHKQSCKERIQATVLTDATKEMATTTTKNAAKGTTKEFHLLHCDICGEDLNLTQINMLRHKMQCQQGKQKQRL